MIDTSKIIHAPVGGGRYTVTSPIVKEDYGLYLKIEGLELPSTYEVDFSNSEHNGTSVTMVGNSDGVLIPNQFISSGKDIFAFLYHVGVDYGRTVYKFRIPNKLRPDRTNEQPTPEEQSVIDQAISALNSAVEQTAQDVIDADASAQSASDDADRAEQARDDAQSYASSANTSSDAAYRSASSAQLFASQAETSAQSAEQTKTEVEGMVDDAQGYASASAQSASASANSASQASGYAQSASASASSAQGYASQAQTSANTASAKASEASQSAQTASQKATEATQSASQASGYASQAENARTSAQTAQGLAEGARDSAISAKEDAEDARDEAQTLVDSISGKTEQIDQNTADIASLEADVSQIKEDLTVVSAKVSAIEEAEGLHKYGVSGIGQSASVLTRIWDSVGMTAQVGTDGDNSNVVNNFDDVTPFNRRKCVGHWEIRNGGAHFVVEAYYGEEGYAEDGSKGDYVAVECPRAYYYLKDGILGVSAHHYQGWRPFDIFCRNHDEEDTFEYAYLPAYALAVDADGHAVSLPGLDNAQGNYAQLLNMARTYKGGALGGFAVIQPAAVNFYEWALFTVEFAQQNSQTVMQGCTSLRHSNDDRVTFVDATHLLTSNYFAARVAGQYISVIAADIDINNSGYLATHKVTAVTRCDSAGNASASGTRQLLTVENLGRNYYEYDTTGATGYRIAARPYRTGCCDGVSTPSGSPVSNNDAYHPMRYRWRENVYGNQFKTSVDLFNKRIGTGDDDYYLEHYYLHDPADYVPANTNKPDAADLQTAVFTKLDVETPHSKYINGYVKSKVYSTEYPDIWIPDETTGGSASTFYADYAILVSSSVVRSAHFGGYWRYGSHDGFSYFAGDAAPSYGTAIYGGDLCFIQAGGESAA